MTSPIPSTSTFRVDVKEEPRDEKVKEEEGDENMHEDAVAADLLEREVEEHGRSTEGKGQPNEDNDRLIAGAMDNMASHTLFHSYYCIFMKHVIGANS